MMTSICFLPGGVLGPLLKSHRDILCPVFQVTCPNCRIDMPRIGLKDTESDKNLREATYHCPQCETETRRWIAL
jgi:hypothetical protein